MQSLTYEERTENLSPLFYSDTLLIGSRLLRALAEYRSEMEGIESPIGVEDFCCWLHNETARERDATT